MALEKDLGQQILEKLEELSKKLDELNGDEYNEEEFSNSSSS